MPNLTCPPSSPSRQCSSRLALGCSRPVVLPSDGRYWSRGSVPARPPVEWWPPGLHRSGTRTHSRTKDWMPFAPAPPCSSCLLASGVRSHAGPSCSGTVTKARTRLGIVLLSNCAVNRVNESDELRGKRERGDDHDEAKPPLAHSYPRPPCALGGAPDGSPDPADGTKLAHRNHCAQACTRSSLAHRPRLVSGLGYGRYKPLSEVKAIDAVLRAPVPHAQICACRAKHV